MATKPGGGGNIQENYDEATGRYIGSDTSPSTGFEQYHSGSGMSKQDVITAITSGQWGSDFADAYNQADNETRNAMVEYAQSTFDQSITQKEKEERYTPLSNQEFYNLQAQSRQSSGLTADDLEQIHHYVGTGSTSFYLNQAMREGYDEMLKTFIQKEGYDPNDNPNDYLTRENVEKYKNAMVKATNSIEAPRDMRVDRYVGTGPLVSWLKGTNILDGIPTINNGWHDKLQPGSYSLGDLTNRLKNLVGSVMPQDGSFLSFSAVPSLSHMKGKRGTRKKDILLKIDVPKGQKMHITGNTHESEGMFPNDIDFYVKDVQLETGDDGQERVVMYYGIKKK